MADGKLSLNVKGKTNKSLTLLTDKLNNGQWHSVDILKKKRKLTILLNGQEKKIVKVPKATVRNEIFIGGVPSSSDYLQVTELVKKIQYKLYCV